MAKYRHFLSVGGTGMLADATTCFAAMSDHQTILARRSKSFVERSGLVDAEALQLDWRRSREFSSGVGTAVSAEGPVDLCLLWIHADGSESLWTLFPILNISPCSLIHVLGSATGDPRVPVENLREKISIYPNLRHRYVALGRKWSQGQSRWLTHLEISAGAIECEITGRDTVVGDLAPR